MNMLFRVYISLKKFFFSCQISNKNVNIFIVCVVYDKNIFIDYPNQFVEYQENITVRIKLC